MSKDIVCKIKNQLKRGMFRETEKYISGLDFQSLKDILFLHAYEDQKITPYAFERYMYENNNDEKWLHEMQEMLFHALNIVEGSYSISLFHIRMKLKMERSVDNMEDLLIFGWCPDEDGMVEKEEKDTVAKEILQLDPHNKYALEYIKNCGNGFYFNRGEEYNFPKVPKLEESLIRAKYKETEQLLAGMTMQEIRDKLVNLSGEMKSIEIYSFVQYMVNKTGSEEWMRIQFDVLTIGLMELQRFGVNSVALFYARELIRIRRSVENLELFLKLYEEPDHVVTNEEAYDIAKEILDIDPENELANRIMESNQKKYINGEKDYEE